MTRHPIYKKPGNDVHGGFGPADCAEIEGAVDAVCRELGLDHGSDDRRLRVKQSVVSTWRSGRRLPLNLVSAGLDAVAG